MLKIRTKGAEATQAVGYKIGQLLEPGSILCMVGDLGAGKTTLTQSIARGLEVDDYVTSPTFTLINEYQGRYPVYHFDVYRIGDVDEMYDLGYEEYIYSDGVTIIEWANMIEEILPKERLNIDIKKGEAIDERVISLQGLGEKYQHLLEELRGSESISD